MDIYIDQQGFIDYLRSYVEGISRNKYDSTELLNQIFLDQCIYYIVNDKVDQPEPPKKGLEEAIKINNDNDFYHKNSCKPNNEYLKKITRDVVQSLKPNPSSDTTNNEDIIQNFCDQWISNFPFFGEKEGIGKSQLQSKFDNPKNIEERVRKYGAIFVGTFDNLKPDSVLKFSGSDVFDKIRSILFIKDKHYPFQTFVTPEMKDWNYIKDNVIETKDIIIVDRYLFNKKVSLFKNNLYNLILSIIGENSKESNVNLLIFSDLDYRQQLISKYVHGGFIEEKLREEVKNKISKLNITFIIPKNCQNLHDRYIITNHRLFTCGHSFSQFYDKKNKFSANGSLWLHAGTLVEENVKNISYALEYLSEIIKCSHIYGDGETNYFDIFKPEQTTDFIKNEDNGKNAEQLLKDLQKNKFRIKGTVQENEEKHEKYVSYQINNAEIYCRVTGCIEVKDKDKKEIEIEVYRNSITIKDGRLFCVPLKDKPKRNSYYE